MPCVVTLTCNLGTWEARIFWVQFCILSSRPTWATESDLISKDQNLPGVVIHIFNSSTQEAETEIADLCEFKAAWSTNGFPGQKGSHSENLSLQKKLNNTSMIFPPAFSKSQFRPQVGGTVMWTLFTLKTCSPIHNTIYSLKLYTGCFTLSPGFDILSWGLTTWYNLCSVN